MGHERLNWIKDNLICAVESQISNLEEVDTKELGEVIDMIKDLEEATYYCTVTEAMKNPEKEKRWEEPEDRRMYYTMMGPHESDTTGHDEHEGRSHKNRRMYMEAKIMNKDKSTQLHELEKYMQELSQDITEMIADSSIEEKQYLEKKITALASKIGQMK